MNWLNYTYTAKLTFADLSGQTAVTRQALPLTDPATALSGVKTLAEHFIRVSTGQLVAVSLEITYTDLNAPAPGASARVEEVALIIGRLQISQTPYVLTIPAPAAALRVDSWPPGYWQVNPAAPALVALLDLFAPGGVASGRGGEPLEQLGGHTDIKGTALFHEERG